MNETLRYVATHLDHYHFNTEKALGLKRKLQYWTTLTPEAQDAMEGEEKLLEQFRSMFSNNPFLEQNGYVSDEWTGDRLPNSITGASAEAYFTQSGTCISLHPPGTQTNDMGTTYMDETVRTGFFRTTTAEASQVHQELAERDTSVYEHAQKRFSHVLRNQSEIKGKTVKSPGLFTALSIVFYYLVVYWYVNEIVCLFPMLKSHGLEIFSGKNQTPFIAAAVIVVLAVAFLIPNLRVLTMSLYRFWTVQQFKRARKQQLKTAQTSALSSNIQTWYTRFSDAVQKDMETLRKAPDTLPVNLESTGMLRASSVPSVYCYEKFPRKPWDGYRETGESRGNKLINAIQILVVLGIVVLVGGL